MDSMADQLVELHTEMAEDGNGDGFTARAFFCAGHIIAHLNTALNPAPQGKLCYFDYGIRVEWRRYNGFATVNIYVDSENQENDYMYWTRGENHEQSGVVKPLDLDKLVAELTPPTMGEDVDQ